MAEIEPPQTPPGLCEVRSMILDQMILSRPPDPAGDAPVEKLTEADAAEMLALATLTEPGPFTRKAQALGIFYGVRIDGRLAAMAGERLKVDGHSELSGVCTHPDFRGRGLARLLSIFVTRQILARGETPFLHTRHPNLPATRLYESIGYTQRTALHLVGMVRA